MSIKYAIFFDIHVKENPQPLHSIKLPVSRYLLKTENPNETKAWYQKLDLQLTLTEACIEDLNNHKALTQWAPFDRKSNYFDPTSELHMLNFRVKNLETLLKSLQREGVQIVEGLTELNTGKFAWILDLNGTKVELWEPKET